MQGSRDMAAAPESDNIPPLPAHGLVVMPVFVTHSRSITSCTCLRPGRRPNGLALSDHMWAEQVELDFPDDVGDPRLAGLAGREVAGLLGPAGAGPVRAVPGEGARGEDLEQERGEREISLFRGKKP
jgi:hypothetical protein